MSATAIKSGRRSRSLPNPRGYIVDPSGNVHRVLARIGQRLLVEDPTGDRWVIGVRRVVDGQWQIGRR